MAGIKSKVAALRFLKMILLFHIFATLVSLISCCYMFIYFNFNNNDSTLLKVIGNICAFLSFVLVGVFGLLAIETKKIFYRS